MPPSSARYTLLFAGAVCVVCAVVVSAAAVSLKERQTANVDLERKRNVLEAVGFSEPGERLPAEQVEERFATIQAVAVDMREGREDPDFDLRGYDYQEAAADPSTSFEAPPNRAQVQRIPGHVLVYKVLDDRGDLEMLILPVQGKGLWSTLYGFLALESDLRTVKGLTFYQHAETPGLGGEVDNPRWKSLWPGRKVFDPEGEAVIEVARGRVGPVATDPYRVDGLSGATITSRGVTNLLRFWLGEHGFGPYLENLEAKEGKNGDHLA